MKAGHSGEEMKFLLVAFLWTCWALPLARADDVAAGRAIAQDQYKGNCLACHRMPGDPSAVTLANLGPVLKDIRSRYPDRAELRRRVWDASTFNPDTIMPPYGRHRILTEQEIDAVVDYIRGL